MIEEELLAKNEKARLNSCFYSLLKHDEGRVVLKAILNIAPLKGVCYSNDALTLAFNEGRRSVSNEILNMIPKELHKFIEDF